MVAGEIGQNFPNVLEAVEEEFRSKQENVIIQLRNLADLFA
jgi:hypothetical protein